MAERNGRAVAFRSSDDLVNRLDLFDANKFLIQAAVEIGESVWIDPKLMQDRGVQVFDV